MDPIQQIILLRKIIIRLNDAHKAARAALLDQAPDLSPLINEIAQSLHAILEAIHGNLSDLSNHLDNQPH